MAKMKNQKKISIIIAAAGNASRLGNEHLISKQFLLLNGKPLLIHSLEKFVSLQNAFEIIIVTNDMVPTSKLFEDFDFLNKVQIKVVEGGSLRQDSVYNGFCNVDSSVDLVVIHDVARPLFKIEDLEKCIEEASTSGAAVLATPLVDTVKCAKSDKDRLIVKNTLNRNELFLIQTPQVFSYNLLSNAYKMFRVNNSKQVVTDEANMVEMLGESVNLVLGDRRNIKISYPEDLEIASIFLKEISKQRPKKVTMNIGAF